MATAFQSGAFQVVAFQVAGAGTLTSTADLQLPINCVLAGQQPYKFSVREYEIHNKNATEKVWGRHTSVRNLRGGKPSFTTKTNNRGYD